jgi:hypothetical protein
MDFYLTGAFKIAALAGGLTLAVAFGWLLITECHNRRNPPRAKIADFPNTFCTKRCNAIADSRTLR